MIKVNKIFFIITILMVLFTIIIPKHVMARPTAVIEDTYQGSGGDGTLLDITGLGNLGDYGGDGGNSTNFDKVVNKVVNFLQVIGSIISVIVLMVVGIKYMFASIEERASYKTTMMPYIIGAFMVFGISNVTGLLYYLAKNIF